ncbi:MAG TPA: hypothetical protein VEL31_03850 [Ktedonobacteraceae bacterium]|nr:hypothetical protein [Ktedonobacteraceae bacterium]
MAQTNPGPNMYTFSGENTQITYYTQTPGPLVVGEDASGGRLEYHGVEGEHTVSGHALQKQDSPLGTLLTVLLKPNNDTGGLTLTVLLPGVFGVTFENPVTFQTLAIKTASRGFVATPGAQFTYEIVPLLATAKMVFIPL